MCISDESVKETDPEREKELSDRIKKIQEQNEKILQRQKEIEDDIEQYAWLLHCDWSLVTFCIDITVVTVVGTFLVLLF